MFLISADWCSWLILLNILPLICILHFLPKGDIVVITSYQTIRLSGRTSLCLLSYISPVMIMTLPYNPWYCKLYIIHIWCIDWRYPNLATSDYSLAKYFLLSFRLLTFWHILIPTRPPVTLWFHMHCFMYLVHNCIFMHQVAVWLLCILCFTPYCIQGSCETLLFFIFIIGRVVISSMHWI